MLPIEKRYWLVEVYSWKVVFSCKPFKYQPHKIVKHTQTNLWQKSTNSLSVFNHFVGLVFKRLFYGYFFNVNGINATMDHSS